LLFGARHSAPNSINMHHLDETTFQTNDNEFACMMTYFAEHFEIIAGST